MRKFRVSLVVITVIANHLLLFPKENGTVPEEAQEIIQKVKEREESLRLEQMRLEQGIAEQEARQKALEKAGKEVVKESQVKKVWDLTIPMIIFLLTELWRQDFQKGIIQDTGDDDDDDDMAALENPFCPADTRLCQYSFLTVAELGPELH